MPGTLVAIPALNEEATIAAVVSEVRLAVPWADIMVIDDGSSDATAAAARLAGARVVSLPFTVGVGGAMRTAFLHAQRYGYDAVVQVDGDGQHVADSIPDLLTALGHSSVVVGSRFPAGGYDVRGPRRWTMHMLAGALTRVCGTTLTDTTSGFRAADRRAIALFAEHYPAEYLGDTVESLVMAARSGLAVSEVPVTMRPRQGGSASHSPVRAGLHLGRAVLALYVALSRRPVASAAARPEPARRPVGAA
jgi:glycosyltransferase involved in cell wall biosynthesis